MGVPSILWSIVRRFGRRAVRTEQAARAAVDEREAAEARSGTVNARKQEADRLLRRARAAAQLSAEQARQALRALQSLVRIALGEEGGALRRAATLRVREGEVAALRAQVAALERERDDRKGLDKAAAIAAAGPVIPAAISAKVEAHRHFPAVKVAENGKRQNSA